MVIVFNFVKKGEILNKLRPNKYVLDLKKPQIAYFCIKNQVNAILYKKFESFHLNRFLPYKSKVKNKGGKK